MRTKVVSGFIFFQELSNKKKIKALRPKMTNIASRGSCLKDTATRYSERKERNREREREREREKERERKREIES